MRIINELQEIRRWRGQQCHRSYTSLYAVNGLITWCDRTQRCLLVLQNIEGMGCRTETVRSSTCHAPRAHVLTLNQNRRISYCCSRQRSPGITVGQVAAGYDYGWL